MRRSGRRKPRKKKKGKVSVKRKDVHYRAMKSKRSDVNEKVGLFTVFVRADRWHTMIIQFTEERGPDILTWITVSAATTWTETSILRTWHQTACQSLASIVFLESSRSGGNPKKSFDIFVIVRRRQMFLEFSTATIVAHLGEQLKYVRNIDCLSG